MVRKTNSTGGDATDLTTLDNDELLTTRQAATVLSVHTGTLYKWAREGTGPLRMKIAGRWRYPRRQLALWIREQYEAEGHAS